MTRVLDKIVLRRILHQGVVSPQDLRFAMLFEAV